jgi:hypothetical protein
MAFCKLARFSRLPFGSSLLLLVRAGGLAALFFGRTTSRPRLVLVVVAAVHLASARRPIPWHC